MASKLAAAPTTVRVANVELNPENPRLPPRDDGQPWNQVSMLAHFAEDKGVRDLAKDIATSGLNPTKRFILQPPRAGQRYIALEGNRRLAAIRLLTDPALAGTTAASKVFRQLSGAATGPLPTAIDCVILTFDQAKHWLEIEHARSQGGKATVSWNTPEHSRFTQLVTGTTRHGRSLALLETMLTRRIIDVPTMKKVPVTTLDRIITDRHVRDVIGWKDAAPPVASIDGALKRIVLDLAGGMPVKKVMDKELRAAYIKKVVANPDKPNISPKPKESSAETSTKNDADKTQRSSQLDWQRKNTIPSSFVCKSKNGRIKEIVKELKELVVADFENAAAMLFRTLLELAVNEYVNKHPLPSVKKNAHNEPALNSAVSEVAKDLTKTQKATNAELAPLRQALSDKYHFLSIESFHGYVHAKFSFPSKKDINRAWDAYQPFFSAIIGAN